MPQHKRIDENKIFSMEREKKFPNSLILEHCNLTSELFHIQMIKIAMVLICIETI